METTVINKINVTDNAALVTILPPQKMPHLAYTVINNLAENKIRLLMMGMVHSDGGITLAVSEDAIPKILKITGAEKGILTAVYGENSKISLLGANLDSPDFIVKNILDPLSEYNADVRIITVSPHEISLVMPSYKTAPFLSEITKFAHGI